MFRLREKASDFLQKRGGPGEARVAQGEATQAAGGEHTCRVPLLREVTLRRALRHASKQGRISGNLFGSYRTKMGDACFASKAESVHSEIRVCTYA